MNAIKLRIFAGACIALVVGANRVTHPQENLPEFPVLTGPYLGQKPPGRKAEVFAPGVISIDRLGEAGSVFSQDGRLFIFRRWFSDKPDAVYITELRDGVWVKPYVAPFCGRYGDWDFNFAPDEQTFYFTSKRPIDEAGEPTERGNIWMTRITPSGWTEPHMLEYPINTDAHEGYPSVTVDGTLYFFCSGRGGLGEADIFRARLENGKYAEVENLGRPVNTEYVDYDLYVAPDESFLVFSSHRPGGYGDSDLYVTYRRKDDTWTEPQNLGEDINSSGGEGYPSVTLDGKFIFFTSNRSGVDDIYWVDAEIIEELKSVSE